MSSIALRGYQDTIAEKVREAFRAGHKRVMLYAPTGAGKTEVAIAMLKAASDKGSRGAMVLDRIVLVEQTSERLQKYSIDHGVMQAQHWRWRPSERIQVCSQQTLIKRGAFPGTKLLIVDEAHTLWASMEEFIKNNPDVYVIGLSASPFSDGLSRIYSTVVSAITTKQLVELKNLVPLKVYVCKEVDMTGAKKVAGEWATDEAASRAMKITGDVVSKWVEMTHEEFGKPEKTIVFCANVAHGADLAQQFAAAGYNFVPISYKDTDDFKADAVKEFSRANTSIHGLIACDILTKGFDVPDVRIGVSARPFTKSFASHVQQMGRPMRPYPGKDYALWLCHSGNYLRFQDDWDHLYEHGVSELKDGTEKPKGELSPEEKERKKCPRCGALWTGNTDTCAACGYVRPRTNQVETVDGVMELVGEKKNKASREQMQAWYSQLLTIQAERGYSRGWAMHKLREKFKGANPEGLHSRTAEVTPEVASWERSRRIAWAKSKANQR